MRAESYLIRCNYANLGAITPFKDRRQTTDRQTDRRIYDDVGNKMLSYRRETALQGVL